MPGAPLKIPRFALRSPTYDPYFAGDTEATIVVFSDFGEHDEMPVSIFFREPSAFFPFEEAALERCRGRVVGESWTRIGARRDPRELPGGPIQPLRYRSTRSLRM